MGKKKIPRSVYTVSLIFLAFTIGIIIGSVFRSFYYIYVITIGLSVAFIELLTRYNKPDLMFKVPAVWIYASVNMIASILAYYIVDKYELVGTTDNGKFQPDQFKMVITAGFGALFVLRSSFTKIKLKNGETIDLGLVTIINELLKWSEVQFDQISAYEDMDPIKETMKNIDFNEAHIDLPYICLSLMKSVDANHAELLGKEISSIKDRAQSDEIKSYLMGTKLFEITGQKLLEKSVSVYEKLIADVPTTLELDETMEELKLKKSSLSNSEREGDSTESTDEANN